VSILVEPFPVTHNILESLTNVTAGNIVTIVRNDPSYLKTRFGVNQGYQSNGFLTELYCYFEGNSLTEAPLPEIFPEESETARLTKTLNVMWGADTQKYYLAFWLSKVLNPTAADWKYRGKISLLKNAGYPYAINRLFDLLTDNVTRQFGENFCLGVSVQDAGNGLLKGNDILTIDGVWVQDNRIFKSEIIPIAVHGGTVQNITQNKDAEVFSMGMARRLVFDGNTSRISATVQNRSAAASIYLAYGDYTPTSTNCNQVIPPNTTGAIPFNEFRQIYAVASTTNVPVTAIQIYNAA
jgi:hypothetical protein